jgi:fumarate reductase subunit D
MLRIVEYSASVLQSSALDSEKEVIIRVLAKIGRLVLKNKYLKSEFQNLTVRFFIPLLGSDNPLLVALTLELLSLYLPFGELDNQAVNRLMELVYDRITNGQFLVIRYNAILAFTALLSHRAALEAAAPHFSRILEIYVGMLSSFEHESLLSCLESIVKHFSQEVVAFAPELISHLVHLFASLCRGKEQPEDEDEPDSNSPATAALSTITQLLDCSLSPEVYLKVSAEITELFRGIFSAYEGYFDAILSLFNVLLHHASAIVDFNYPYVACRKLLEGDNSLLELAQLPHEAALEISSAEQADSEFSEELVSILKNLIQKMPIELLRRYPYPNHPQLILCLIENKRLEVGEIYRLDTSQVDQAWLPYIVGYTQLIYGVG